MGKIKTNVIELEKAKKERVNYSEEYKQIQKEADEAIESNKRREIEAYKKAKDFIANNYVIDPVDMLIKLIRRANTEEDAKKILMKKLRVLLETKEAKAIIENSKKEGPNTDYFAKNKNKCLSNKQK